MKPHEAHKAEAKKALDFHIVTVSSSRYKLMSNGSEYDDDSGDLAALLIQESGHKVDNRSLIPDSKSMIEDAVKNFLRSRAHTLVLIGGTGLSPDDVTVETVAPFFEKELSGFGELLRNLSYKTIGSAAMLTRATAGTAEGKLLVCLPGSPNAVGTALRNFISEFPHIVLIAGGHTASDRTHQTHPNSHVIEH